MTRNSSALGLLKEAASSGALTVRDPRTDLPFQPKEIRTFYELMSTADIDTWLQARGVDYRLGETHDETTTEIVHLLNSAGARTSTNLARVNILTSVIEAARKAAIDCNNYQAVWAELVKMAQSKDRPPPLTGYAEREGVLYQDENDPCKALTKTALKRRIERSPR